jgi:hypothetical protein
MHCLYCREEFHPVAGNNGFCSWECEERQSAAEDAYYEAYHSAAPVN